MREIRWSARALQDLRQLGRYIASHNPAAARRLIQRLRAKVSGIPQFPLMGRVVPELMQNDIREVLEKNYRIVYLVTDDAIEVITIFEAHRLFPIALEEDESEEAGE